MALPVLGMLAGAAISAFGANSAADSAADGQRDAANISQTTAREQMALQTRMWEQGREDLAPYQEAGNRGLGLYELAAYSPFQFDLASDSVYKTQMEEATKAIERSGAARGGLTGGGTLRSLRDATASEVSSAYWRQYGARQDELNRFGALAGIGQGAAQTLGSLGGSYSGSMAQIGVNAGNNAANAASNIGQINAAGTSGMYNSIGQGLSSIGMMYGMNDELDTEGKY